MERSELVEAFSKLALEAYIEEHFAPSEDRPPYFGRALLKLAIMFEGEKITETGLMIETEVDHIGVRVRPITPE
jgi:hypothetical protein